MENIKKLTLSGLFALALILTTSNIVNAEEISQPLPANFRVAIVDVPRLVNQSKEVQALKKEQQDKMAELQKWLEVVKADIQKQSTQEGKDKLLKKYDADFAKKQEAIKKNYKAKLEAIDKNISALIAKEAKAQNYDLVISKGVVLYGGVDITPSLIKLVK